VFSWVQFLKNNSIEFVERGPNVAKGNVNISCPFCGDDPSHHLGLNLERNYWGCWRNKQHRGKSPRRLVQRLLNCSYEQAQRIVGEDVTLLPEKEDFNSQIQRLMNGNGYYIETEDVYKATVRNYLSWPFRKIEDIGSGKIFFDYLVKDRKYSVKEVVQLVEDYQLGYSLIGKFNFRIVIPVIMEQGLVTWTGRAITDSTLIRYKTLSVDKDEPKALVSIKDSLWNYKNLVDYPGHTLYVCEGPFDSMRVDFFGKKNGIRATCLFSKNVSDAQLILLDELSYLYDNKFLLLDQDARVDTFWILDELKHMKFEPAYLTHVKDPAKLSAEEIVSM
jgi:hypothetical protein